MFETITDYLHKLEGNQYGEWHIDTEGEGTMEHPYQFPFVNYNDVISEFEKTVLQFVEEHKELELTHYSEILQNKGIRWDIHSMTEADVSYMDGQTTAALIVGAIRAERFCDGALLEFFQNGCINRWILRLKEIDDKANN